MIKDVQIEGAEKEELHTVQFAGELAEDCWKDVKEIKDAAWGKEVSSALESLIEEANGEIVESEIEEPEMEQDR